jgi:DNA polymerase III subunit alpha, Gram-positive type
VTQVTPCDAGHEIIAIAAIRVNRDFDLHETFRGLVKPKRKISAKISSVTGITNDMQAREGERLEDVMVEFLDFVCDRLLVFYNAAFGMAFSRPRSAPSIPQD